MSELPLRISTKYAGFFETRTALASRSKATPPWRANSSYSPRAWSSMAFWAAVRAPLRKLSNESESSMDGR